LIDDIDRNDVHESEQSRQSTAMRIASEYKKGHNNQLACDCCHASFPCGEVHGYLHPQMTQKGSMSLNKLDNKPDWFFATQNDKLVYTTTLWTERCLTTHGISLLRKRANNSPAMDVARVHCP
jgi:hypothetical protein